MISSWYVYQAIKEEIKMTKLEGYDLYGGASGTPLKGIIKIEQDTNHQVGLEIQGLLSINNKTYVAGEELLGTEGNLCLRDHTADYLIETNIIELTIVKEIVEGGFVVAKIYKDSIGNHYMLQSPDILTFVSLISDSSPEEILPITKAPNWSKESVFKLLDVSKIIPMIMIRYIVFDQKNTSTIIAPKTVYSYFQQGGIFKNFSGIFDISHMNPTTEEQTFIFDTDSFENCEDGTLRVNASQWDIFETAERITDAEGVKMLDGKIKIVKATEGGSS